MPCCWCGMSPLSENAPARRLNREDSHALLCIVHAISESRSHMIGAITTAEGRMGSEASPEQDTLW